MFSVETPAATTALTTLEALKLDIGIESDDNDAWLDNQIEAWTQVVCDHLRIAAAEDGSRNLGVETLIETIDRTSRYPFPVPFGLVSPRREADTIIILARRPIVSIASITEDGIAVDPSNFVASNMPGTVKRFSNGLPAAWAAETVVVTYTAGWLLPGDDGRNLPLPIEKAVIELVQAAWYARKRDPAVKSESIPGVRQVDYFFGTPGQSDGPLPVMVLKRLAPYVNLNA